MKNILKNPVMLLLIVLSMSCEDQQFVDKMPEPTRTILESEQFKNLNIRTSDLITSKEPQQTPSRHGTALILNFRENENKKLFAVVNERKEILNVFTFEIQPQNNVKNLSESFRNRTFSGNLILAGNTIYTFKIESFKIVNFAKQRIYTSAYMQPSCNDMEDVYWCAAATIDNMGTISWLACMAQIVPCMGIAMADCLLAGCPRTGL